MPNLIDLHLHTTSSDGRSTPEDLVRRAHGVGIRAMSVTDHDTMSGVAPAAAAAAAAGIEFVPGIEITCTERGKNVHMLGYYLPVGAEALETLLATQRRMREERAVEIGRRLEQMGAPIDVAAMVASAQLMSGKALARPQIAQYLVAAGHVDSIAQAFERYLGEDCPAYVPHDGARPADVVALIVRLGGIASLAHPGQLNGDGLIPDLVAAGLGCIEAYHSSHDASTQAHYVSLARRFGVGVTGGSDYHGEGTRRSEFFGVLSLPAEDFEAFKQRVPSPSAGEAFRS